MIRNGQDHWLAFGPFLERLPHVPLVEKPVTRSYIQATRDPSAAVARNLIVVSGRMIRLPRGWRASPVTETSAKQTKLCSVHRVVDHCLAREIERNMLFQKPMAIRPNYMETRTMRGREPMMINDPATYYLVQTVRRRPPVSGAAVSFSAERMRVIVEM